jgi:hypothetical protein
MLVDLSKVVEPMFEGHLVLVAVRDEHDDIVDLHVRSANAAACRMFRLPRTALEGRAMLDIFPQHAENGVLALFAGALLSQEPLIIDDFRFPSDIDPDDRAWDLRGIPVGDVLLYGFRMRDAQQREDDALRRLVEVERQIVELRQYTRSVIDDVIQHLVGTSMQLVGILEDLPDERRAEGSRIIDHHHAVVDQLQDEIFELHRGPQSFDLTGAAYDLVRQDEACMCTRPRVHLGADLVGIHDPVVCLQVLLALRRALDNVGTASTDDRESSDLIVDLSLDTVTIEMRSAAGVTTSWSTLVEAAV